MKTFFNIRQKDEENLTTYLDRFKAAHSNMKTQLGSVLILPAYVKSMDGYVEGDHSKTDELIVEAHEEFKAYAFIVNSDKNKYGTLIKNLAQQQSLKNDQYPKTLKAAAEVLENHTWDQKYHDEKNKRKKQRERDTSDNNTQATMPSSIEDLEISFAQLQNACYCCGKKGHGSDKCYQRNTIPRDQWYINKLQKKETDKILAQVANDSSSVAQSAAGTTNEEQQSSGGTAWSGAHIGIIMLDNGSTKRLFANERMVRDVEEADKRCSL